MSCQRETQLKEGENRDMTDSKKSGRTQTAYGYATKQAANRRRTQA
jgi:hypothetical protein